jgi:hypothetical protein
MPLDAPEDTRPVESHSSVERIQYGTIPYRVRQTSPNPLGQNS